MYEKSIFYRNDAGLAAAELALAIEKHVLDSGSIDTVGTVGMFYKSYLTSDTKPISFMLVASYFPAVHLD
jgi:hypothetical protein